MAKDYDKTLTRLIGILTKLANNEYPTTKELAQEYGVSVRTIQKDINQRLYHYPIVKDSSHRYYFEYGFSLRKTFLSEEELIFLDLALSQFDEVEDIKYIKEKIYKKIISKPLITPYHINQEDIEDIDIDSKLVETLEEVIKDKNIVEVKLTNTTKKLAVLKIISLEGLWYIAARDLEDEKIKIFRLFHIKSIKRTKNYHDISYEDIENLLDKIHSPFFQDGNSFKVVVKVYKEIAEYFTKRELLDSQKIEETLDDGSVIVSFEVSHDEDIDNIIKSFLPHIEVIEPKRYKEKLLKELQAYIDKAK